jgi:hypothetical protein
MSIGFPQGHAPGVSPGLPRDLAGSDVVGLPPLTVMLVGLKLAIAEYRAPLAEI